VADWDNKKADPYVILTVLDEKEKQIWRFDSNCVYDSLNPVFDQTFLIPGCPGATTLVLTCIDKDELRDQFLGQAYINLCPRPTNEIFRFGGKFKCELDELFYMPLESSGADQRMDFSDILPSGTVEVEIEPMDGVISFCGALIGPPLDDEATFASFKQVEIKKSRKCWCVLADHKLYLYTSFGAPHVKLEIDLKTSVVEIKTKERNMPFTVTAKNGAEYTFVCQKLGERDRWRMALECSYEYYNNKRTRGSAARIDAIVALTHRRKGQSQSNIKLMRKRRQKQVRTSKEAKDLEPTRDSVVVASGGVDVKEEVGVMLIREENSLELPSIHKGSPLKRGSPTFVKGSHNVTRKAFKEQKAASKKLEEKRLRKEAKKKLAAEAEAMAKAKANKLKREVEET